LIISTSEAGREALPLPEMPRLTWNASKRLDHPPHVPGAGVQVVAKVPCEGPVPPPSIEVTPDINECSICCGQMKWMWLSNPPAVRIFPSPAMMSVPGPITMGHAGLDVGIAGLADGADHAFLIATIGLDDAPVVNNERIGDDGVGCALLVGDLRLTHAVADHLAAAEFYFLAVGGEILLDLDDEISVGKPHPVAGGRPEHVGIDGTFDFYGHEMKPRLRAVILRCEPTWASLEG